MYSYITVLLLIKFILCDEIPSFVAIPAWPQACLSDYVPQGAVEYKVTRVGIKYDLQTLLEVRHITEPLQNELLIQVR